MNIILDKNLVDSMQTIIQYQNNLLIRNISQDKSWNLAELKKYIKPKNIKKQNIDTNLETSVKNTEIKKIPVKEKEKKPPTEIKKKNKIIKKKIIESDGSESEGKIKILKKKIIVKRRKKKMTPRHVNIDDTKLGKDETLCQMIEFMSMEFFLNPTNNYVYQLIENEKEIEFVGILEGDIINFDAESSED
jgi:hypothetical protein